MPPGVSAGTPAAKQAYASAEAFEQMLVGELSQSLVQGSGLEGEGGSEAGGGETAGREGAGGGDPLLSALVPQALSESVMRGGGLGLAGPLAAALDPAAAGASGASARQPSSASGSASTTDAVGATGGAGAGGAASAASAVGATGGAAA